MTHFKLQGAFLVLLLSCQILAIDYKQFQTNDCKCTCNCNVPIITGGSNGNNTSTNTGGNTGGSTGGSTGGNTGGSSSGKNARDFKAWFANMQKDPWGKYGLPVILQRINGGITQAQADKWLGDITNAAKVFPDFCNSGNEQNDKQEFAAFMSIIGAETSFDPSNGFPCTKETGCPNCDACSYNSKGKECTSNPDKQYFGRGPLQISWDYNYVNFSQYYFNDDRLVTNPNVLTQSEQTCWASAIWFWMTPQNYGGWCMPQAAWPSRDSCSKDCPNGPVGCSNTACVNNHWLAQGKISPHDAIQTGKGMGQVINIINGGYDCCPSTTYFGSYGHTLNRVQWYAEILQLWGQPLPWTTLATVPIEECPAAQGTIDCSRLTSSTCYWNCCNAKSK